MVEISKVWNQSKEICQRQEENNILNQKIKDGNQLGEGKYISNISDSIFYQFQNQQKPNLFKNTAKKSYHKEKKLSTHTKDMEKYKKLSQIIKWQKKSKKDKATASATSCKVLKHKH